MSEGSAVGYFSCAKTLAAYGSAVAVTFGAELLAVAVAFGTVVVDLALAPRALDIALVTAGGTVKDRLLECARPECLHRDEHREHCYKEHSCGNDYYSFLCEFHFCFSLLFVV